MSNTTRLKRVTELRCGDFVDLEGDKYADPDYTNADYPQEFELVDDVEPEEPHHLRVHFAAHPSLVFPLDHVVPVRVEAD